MADETAEFQLSCVHCEAKDFNTGRCRIAPRIIEKICGKINSPVPLTLQWTQDLSFVLCGHELMETTMLFNMIRLSPSRTARTRAELTILVTRGTYQKRRLLSLSLWVQNPLWCLYVFAKELKILITT